MSNVIATRKVTVLFTQTSTREPIETAARTWGELQREIQGTVSNKRCVVRETKNTLESSEAVLPTGNFVIFAYPKESKGGAKKVAKKSTKRPAKKVAKKAAKKVAKKKPATKKAVSGKSAKATIPAPRATAVAKPSHAVATNIVASVQENKVKEQPKEENINDLLREASEIKRTI